MSNKKQDIYAIYIRVSTERQAEHGDSIEMQEALGMQIIKENNGIHYRTYIEPAVSASKTELKNREVLMECLNDAKNGLFNKLIVYKRDRLARKLEDTTTTKKIKIGIHLDHHKYNFFEWIQAISNKIKSSFIDWIKLHVDIKSARQMHRDTGVAETTCREIINKERIPMPKTIKRIVEAYHLNLKSFIDFMGVSISEEGLFHVVKAIISRGMKAS